MAAKKTIIEGSNVSLPCQVYALPPPSITWLLNGADLRFDDGKYLIENDTLRYDMGERGVVEIDFFLTYQAVMNLSEIRFSRGKAFFTLLLA